MSVWDQIGKDIDEWLEGFQNSPTVKALGAAFDTVSYLNSAYKFWMQIFFPEPNYGALILKALEALREDIHDLFTDLGNARAEKLVRFFRDYNALHDPEYLDELLDNSNGVKTELATIIRNWDPRDAYRVCEMYNLVIPLDAVNYLQAAAHAQDKGTDPDWPAVRRRVVDEFQDAIQVNEILLGPHCCADAPGLPCYASRDGKLFKALKDEDIEDEDEYIRVTEYVWQATERLREKALDGYADLDTWFTINRKRSTTCLSAAPGADGNLQAHGGTCQDDRNHLWRVEYLRHDVARIVHWLGWCLTVDDLELHGGERAIRLLQCGGSGQEYNYEVFVQEGDHIRRYWRGWGDGVWHRGESFGTNVQSAPAVFQNLVTSAGGYNVEVFVQEGDQIQHYWRGRRDSEWLRGARFGENVQSAPAVFQNRTEYNYEVFVREGDQIQHYWRDWEDGRWHRGARFGRNVRSAPAVFHNRPARRKNRDWKKWNDYEVFVRELDHIQHYWRSWEDGEWHEGGGFGDDVRSGPAVFQNLADEAAYNYEVFVREGNRLQPYWYSWNDDEWHIGQHFGANVQSAPAAFQNGVQKNYEVFVRQGDHIQHYWRSWADGQWRPGQRFGEGVQSAPAAFQHRSYRDGQLWDIAHVPRAWTGEQGIVAARLNYYFCPPGEDDWYIYSKYAGIREVPTASSNAYIPGRSHQMEFKDAFRTRKGRPVALRAHSGHFVCAEEGGGRELAANRTMIGTWETFFLSPMGDSRVALRVHNSQYVCAEGGGGGPVVANRDWRLSWETFELVELADGDVTLRAHNGRYVCAEGGGGGAVVANRTRLGPWETFHLVALRPETMIALKTDNGHYVSAENGGGGAVTADRNSAAAWESYRLIDLGGKAVALSTHDGHYLCAEGGGGGPIVANRERIGAWETFELMDLGEDRIALKAANGQYVCAEGGGGREIVANRDAIGRLETFTRVSVR
jgi:hypothetical protein